MNLSLNNFNQIHSIMTNEDVVLVYSGEFDQEIIKSMLTYIEDKLEFSDIDGSARKKLFNVMVEMLQNIVKHQPEKRLETKAVFLLIEKEEQYELVTGNPIAKELTQNLQDKIEEINSKDPLELKAFYKETRLAARISGVGGAGLGFIDMARKSGNKLEYIYYDSETNDYKYFALKTRINKNK